VANSPVTQADLDGHMVYDPASHKGDLAAGGISLEADPEQEHEQKQQQAQQQKQQPVVYALVPVYDRTIGDKAEPPLAQREVTYQAHTLKNGKLKEIKGPAEITMSEELKSGDKPRLCTPCTNKADPSLRDYNAGQFNDGITVGIFGGPFVVSQSFKVNGQPAAVFRKQSDGSYLGSHKQQVDASRVSIAIRPLDENLIRAVKP
jgi:hypothetical protein